MLVDVGVNATPSDTPDVQVYDVAPAPVSVTPVLKQMSVAVALAVTLGDVFTETDTTAVLEQLFVVPETVYVLDDIGENDNPSVTPDVQVYVVAPPPVNVTLDPEQIVDAVVFAVTFGKGFTETDTTAVFVQLFAEPITV